MSPMPDRHDPDNIALRSIEEPIWPDDHLTIGQVRELWNGSPRLGVSLKPPEYSLGLLAEILGSSWVVATNVLQALEKLAASGDSELDLHC